MDPIVLGLALIPVAALLFSGRVRTIVRVIFLSPTKRTVVLTLDGETITLENLTAEQQNQLIEAFVRRHTAPDEGDPDVSADAPPAAEQEPAKGEDS
jgi:hypothetical protein